MHGISLFPNGTGNFHILGRCMPNCRLTVVMRLHRLIREMIPEQPRDADPYGVFSQAVGCIAHLASVQMRIERAHDARQLAEAVCDALSAVDEQAPPPLDVSHLFANLISPHSRPKVSTLLEGAWQGECMSSLQVQRQGLRWMI